jgi:hypothetical protein
LCRYNSAMDGEVMELLECTVCTELLLDPVTTSCGHTFCRACLRQSMVGPLHKLNPLESS